MDGISTSRGSDRSGGPAVPTGRLGRAATGGFIIRDQLFRDRSKGEMWNRAFVLAVEPAWRGLLSLRDPAGAAHAAGPPSAIHSSSRQR